MANLEQHPEANFPGSQRDALKKIDAASGAMEEAPRV
jgi:hypothetical protein